mgnify:CR=1 FL=1
MYTKTQKLRDGDAARTMLPEIHRIVGAIDLCLTHLEDRRQRSLDRTEWELDVRDDVYACYRDAVRALQVIAPAALAYPDEQEYRDATAAQYRAERARTLVEQERYRQSRPFLERRRQAAWDALWTECHAEERQRVDAIVAVLCEQRLV